jgi:protein-S-isoprenylcysteine O-methyltransferase Ste14
LGTVFLRNTAAGCVSQAQFVKGVSVSLPGCGDTRILDLSLSFACHIREVTLAMRFLELRIPPPVIDAACATLMWWLTGALPAFGLWPSGARPFGLGAALGLALAGSILAVAGIREFRRARTTGNPLAPERASALVTTGVYRHTRNPMYLGMLLVLLGWAAYLGNAAALLGPMLSVLLLNQLQIKPEERILRERFGEHYARYAARVRRWV